MRSEERQEGGFTLIEALIAIIILMVGLLGISQLFIAATSSNSIANRATASASIASREMERLKAIPFIDGRLNEGGNYQPAPFGNCGAGEYCTQEEVPGVGTVVTRWQITDVGVALPARMKYIRMRTEVLGAFSALSRAEFTTYRSLTM
jgi:type II secretory pathway pseudopilin PulG